MTDTFATLQKCQCVSDRPRPKPSVTLLASTRMGRSTFFIDGSPTYQTNWSYVTVETAEQLAGYIWSSRRRRNRMARMASTLIRTKSMSVDAIVLPHGCEANRSLGRDRINGERTAAFVLKENHSVHQVDLAFVSGDSATTLPIDSPRIAVAANHCSSEHYTHHTLSTQYQIVVYALYYTVTLA